MSATITPAQIQPGDHVMRGTWRELVAATVDHSGQPLPFVAACLVDVFATAPTERTRNPGSAQFRDLVNRHMIERTGHALTRGDLRRALEELHRRKLLPTWQLRSAASACTGAGADSARACDGC